MIYAATLYEDEDLLMNAWEDFIIFDEDIERSPYQEVFHRWFLFFWMPDDEEEHEVMFRELADRINQETMFSKETEKKWKCLNCGYIHTGKNPPDKCPACVKPAGHFELYEKNW